MKPLPCMRILRTLARTRYGSAFGATGPYREQLEALADAGLVLRIRIAGFPGYQITAEARREQLQIEAAAEHAAAEALSGQVARAISEHEARLAAGTAGAAP